MRGIILRVANFSIAAHRGMLLRCTRLFSSSADDELRSDSSTDSNSDSDYSSDGEDQTKTDMKRSEILQAALSFVPQHGWTKQSLMLGAEKVELPGISHSLIGRGPIELVEFFNTSANYELEDKLATEQDSQLSTHQFLHSAVTTRLKMLTPYIHHWPQAMAMMALPSNAPTALKNLTRMVDDMWYYAGDRSTYFDWYPKRAGLAMVYTSAEVYMIQDSSQEFENTWNFVDRQLACYVRLGQRIRECQNVQNKAGDLLYSAIQVGRNIASVNDRRR